MQADNVAASGLVPFPKEKTDRHSSPINITDDLKQDALHREMIAGAHALVDLVSYDITPEGISEIEAAVEAFRSGLTEIKLMVAASNAA